MNRAMNRGVNRGVKRGERGACLSRGFTLVELLVSLSVVAVLVGLLAPTLAGAREGARGVVCLSSLRQIGSGWALYAGDYGDRAMPLAYFEGAEVGAGDGVFWFGTDGRRSGHVEFGRGFIAPYLSATGGLGSVFECPSQPWGSYAPQTRTGQPTTTYGYNGYYLSPRYTPGWGGRFGAIGHRPWPRVSGVSHPSLVLAFADTLLPVGAMGRSTALLDPPELFRRSGEWAVNEAPTTSFRHRGLAQGVKADGSARGHGPGPGAVYLPRYRAGSVGARNDPAYVPDWARW